MKVTVTQEHITEGIRSDCWRCPVAQAVAATGLKGYMVGLFAIVNPNTDQAYSIPQEVRERIIKFDEHGTMEPFEFDLVEKT